MFLVGEGFDILREASLDRDGLRGRQRHTSRIYTRSELQCAGSFDDQPITSLLLDASHYMSQCSSAERGRRRVIRLVRRHPSRHTGYPTSGAPPPVGPLSIFQSYYSKTSLLRSARWHGVERYGG